MPRIEVLSSYDADGFAADVPWAAISIADEEQWWPALGRANRVGHFRLAFEDLERDGGQGERYFTLKDAEQILEFVDSVWPKIGLLVITCEVGLARGPAIAAALHRIHYGSDGAFFDCGHYYPNLLVYRAILEASRRRGEDDEPS